MELTYEPLDEGDPPVMTWNGRRFRANIPQIIPDNDGFMITETVRSERPDGTVVLVSRERFITYAELGRNNPYFRVNDEPKMERKFIAEEDMCTPAHYAAFAHRWIRMETDLKKLRERWESEEDLRYQCNVAEEDLRAMRPILDIKIDELKQVAKAERLERAAQMRSAEGAPRRVEVSPRG